MADDWKILREVKNNGRVRRYNLAKDPFEKNDLASELPERAEQLHKQLIELDASCQRSRDGADYRY